jgi:hypothetical protein
MIKSTGNRAFLLEAFMDRQRDAFVREIGRLKGAREKTRSSYLRRDYGKAIRRMENELRQYDSFRKAGAR